MPVDDDTHATIRQRQQSLRQQLEAIRADQGLTFLGKREKIQAAYEASKAEVDDLRTEGEAAFTAHLHELRRSMFAGGSDPAGMVSYRDALVRAEGLTTPAAAARALARAQQAGDTDLARAIAATAWDRRSGMNPEWGQVVDGWVEANPRHRKAANELAALSDAAERRSQQMQDKMNLHVSTPPEITVRGAVADG